MKKDIFLKRNSLDCIAEGTCGTYVHMYLRLISCQILTAESAAVADPKMREKDRIPTQMVFML
jgi:hypothetical protein